MNAACGSFLQRLAKGGVGSVIGCKKLYAFHLNYKHYICAKALGYSFAKLLCMSDSSFGGSVGKHSNAVFFKGNALDLDKTFPAADVLHIKIKA